MTKMRDREMTLLCLCISILFHIISSTLNLEGVSVSTAESPREAYQCIISLQSDGDRCGTSVEFHEVTIRQHCCTSST